MQSIFLLPKNITDPGDIEHDLELDVLYAPVSRHSVPKELQDQAIEAWVPRGTVSSQSSFHSSSTMTSELRNQHQHQRRHHRHHSSRYRSCSPSSEIGTIKLEVSPDEGLFPGNMSVLNGDQKICWWRMLFFLLSDISIFILFSSYANWNRIEKILYLYVTFVTRVTMYHLWCSISFQRTYPSNLILRALNFTFSFFLFTCSKFVQFYFFCWN